MTIKDLCSETVITIPESASIQACAQMMEEKRVGSILVTKVQSDNQNPIGIITDRDIIVKLVAKKTDLSSSTVRDVMTTDLLMLRSDQDIKKAIEEMRAKGVRRAPVVNKENKICGIVAVDDLIIKISRELNAIADLVKNQISGHK